MINYASNFRFRNVNEHPFIFFAGHSPFWIRKVFTMTTMQHKGVHDLAWTKKLPRPGYKTLEKIPQSQPWFHVYRLPEDVYSIYEEGQYDQTLSHLVVGDKLAMLVDTGNGIADLKKCVRELTDKPVLVVNTHSHRDHLGQNWAFDDVAAFDDELGIARKYSSEGYPIARVADMVAPDAVCVPFPPGFDPSQYRIRPYTVTRWLKDGDIIDLGGRVFEVVHTPGHSPDSICLLERAKRILFTGDTFYPGIMYTYLLGGSLEQLENSYHKITEGELGAAWDYAVPSHDEPRVEQKVVKQVITLLEKIHAGAVEPDAVIDGGKRKYLMGNFGLLLGPDQ